MSPRKLTEIPGVRLKFRHSPDGRWLTATVWTGDTPLKEIARLDASLVDEPGGEVYQGWVAAISAAFGGLIADSVGVAKVEVLRRKADYKGEDEP